MGSVTLSRPGLFFGRGPVVVREGSALFYTFDPGRDFTFTLPVGTYDVEGGRYAGPYVPPKDLRSRRARGLAIPRRIRVVFAPNPNKCSVNMRRGVIVCDPSLKELSRTELTFVLFHEIGHFYYFGAVTPDDRHEQEVKCDAFASEQMLLRGWNPSQIAAACEQTLSECSRGRKDEHWEAMKHVRHVR